MRACDEHIRQTLELVEAMLRLADQGDAYREDVGCGVLYGVLRDAAFKIRKLAAAEREAHIRKGWWRPPETTRTEANRKSLQWRCTECGVVVGASQAPEGCSTCARSGVRFELLAENW